MYADCTSLIHKVRIPKSIQIHDNVFLNSKEDSNVNTKSSIFNKISKYTKWQTI